MAPHHEPGHGHPLTNYEEPRERSMDEPMEVLEMGRNSRGGLGLTFDWSLNVGHLLAIASVVVGCTSTYYGIKGEISDQAKETGYLAARVVLIEKDRADKLPRLEEALRMNGLQDQRIQNLTDALSSLRTTVTDLARVVASQADLIHDTDKREAILEERTTRSGPHDR